MGVHGKVKRQRRARSSLTADAIDLISGLGDHVLVHILELLPDARDAVRTGALSRRWRGLWTRIPDPRFFASDPWPEKFSDAERFTTMGVHGKAKRRKADGSAGDAVDLISGLGDDVLVRILELLPDARDATMLPGSVDNGIYKNMKRLLLKYVDNGICENEYEYEMMNLDSLPVSAKMVTMRLALHRATVQLPSSASFASLTDLTLEHMVLADGSVRLLARLLSSACCPCLLKLRLRKLELERRKPTELQLNLEANKLLELSLERIVTEMRSPSRRRSWRGSCS
ncbi:hypothetical protein EJB05_39271, partial [Eragrostis curvula]